MNKVDFSYEISEERLRAYARLTLMERLQWLDSVRLFTLMAQNAPVVAREDSGNMAHPAETDSPK